MPYYDYKYGYAGQGPPIVYQGLVSGLRVSAVDGTAFIDGANASITALADGLHKIEIYDSANRMVWGVLKAAGTEETSTELLTGWINNGSLEVFNTTGVNIDLLTETGTNGACPSNHLDIPAGTLLKVGFNYTLISGGTLCNMRMFTDSGGDPVAGTITNAVGASGAKSYYGTQPSTANSDYIAFRVQVISMSTAATSAAKVLTPSTSGATIVSAKAGVTYNFAYKNASFDYAGAQTSCTVIIKKLR